MSYISKTSTSKIPSVQGDNSSPTNQTQLQEKNNQANLINTYDNLGLDDNQENPKEKIEYKEQPIQLIEFQGSKFKLNPEALKLISSIENDIIVVSIVGKARTGKSYLMNLLLDRIGKDSEVFILNNNPIVQGPVDYVLMH
jgi:ATPase subunit of ABC transporter with duplicated ATPase domains